MTKEQRREYMREYKRKQREAEREKSRAARAPAKPPQEHRPTAGAAFERRPSREHLPAVGDTFERKPSAFSREGWSGPVTLHWTVIAVNEKHRTYTAEAACNGCCLRETFKF